MAGNPLVATATDTATPFSGAGLLDDGAQLTQAIQSGDWVAGGVAAFSAALDTVATASDPLGSLIAAGLGWLMDHLEPLKGWLNDLTGDAGEVQAFSQTWANISQQLTGAGSELSRILADVESLHGEAMDAYRAFQADAAKHISAAGEWASGLSTGLGIASTIVQVVHDITRDAIAQIVGSAISWAAEAVFSLGLATPWIIEQVTTRVSSLATKIGTKVTDLLKSVKSLKALLDKLGPLLSKAKTLLDKVLPGGKSAARDAENAVPGAHPHDTPDTSTPSHVPDDRPYIDPKNRPSFRNGVPEQVWENAKDADGKVWDPLGDEINWTPGTPRKNVWDMGHLPEEKYSEVHARYVNGEMTPAEFRDWYNDPANYRPELPSTNRSHRAE